MGVNNWDQDCKYINKSAGFYMESDLFNEIKWEFFEAVTVSILRYGCTTWTLTKHWEKKLDGKFTRMLHAILDKFWKWHPTKQQLYGYLLPNSHTIQVG